MPTSTYVPLATVTVSTATNTVTFGSIPATFRDFVIQGTTRSTRSAATEDLFFRLNGDTGANYTSVSMRGSSVSIASFTFSTLRFDNTIAGTGTANLFSNVAAHVMDYSATDKHTTLIQRMATGNQDQVLATAARYTSTTAINSVTLFYPIGNIATGTTFSLYGIAA